MIFPISKTSIQKGGFDLKNFTQAFVRFAKSATEDQIKWCKININIAS